LIGFFPNWQSVRNWKGQLSPEDLPQLLQAGSFHVPQQCVEEGTAVPFRGSSQDRANGYAPKRTLKSAPPVFELERPRTREGFYPAVLPKHQRHLPEAYQQLLLTFFWGQKL